MRAPVIAAASLSLVAASLILTSSSTQAAAVGCASGVPMDFNGDGYSDAAIANSTATEAGQVSAGRVTIRYGDSDGRVGEGPAQNIRADTGNDVTGTVQPGARFGYSLASADLDCDGYTDLVIGAPTHDNPGAPDSGTVTLIYGGPTGFTASSRQDVQTSDNFNVIPGAGDRFGFSVDAFEDLGQGGTAAPNAYAILIGVPYRDTAGKADAGAVAAISSVDGDISDVWISEESHDMAGIPEAGDMFGFSVALGQFSAATSDIDALVGVPGEDVGSVANAGAVVRLEGLYGDNFSSSKVITQNSSGVPGSAEVNDQFGRVVDSYTNGTTTRAVVAAPFEDIGSVANAGAIQLFAKTPSTNFTPGVSVSQDTAGVEGAAEKNDNFGSDVAIGPGYYTAVGVPGEDTSITDVGLVQIIPLTNPAADKAYTQASTGVPGTAKAGERLGSTVGVIDGVNENLVLAGVPADVENSDGLVNVFPFTTGTPRYWAPTGVGGAFGDGLGSQGR